MSRFNRTVDFIYLDSYDFDEKNRLPSQIHHLKEIAAVCLRLNPKAIVLLDDSTLPCEGKCRFVSSFLVREGWKVVANVDRRLFVRGMRHL